MANIPNQSVQSCTLWVNKQLAPGFHSELMTGWRHIEIRMNYANEVQYFILKGQIVAPIINRVFYMRFLVTLTCLVNKTCLSFIKIACRRSLITALPRLRLLLVILSFFVKWNICKCIFISYHIVVNGIVSACKLIAGSCGYCLCSFVELLYPSSL